jgi:predicted short-subunit dehydrogenase-like oxidoreductase (DUF2520 family)
LEDCRVAILGAGRLGTSLALALREAGADIRVLTDAMESPLLRAKREFGLPTSPSVREVVKAGANVLCLTVPDGALAAAALELGTLLARENAEGRSAARAVLHTSGATSVAVLAPCAQAGAVTLSLHPLQTFSDPRAGAKRLSGAAIAVTPGPGGGWELGELLARSVGGRPFLLREEDRVLYHAAACVASNYLVSLEYAAEDLFCRAGMSREDALPAFLPLVQGAVDNLAERGAVAALTGPLSRGDVDTVTAHLLELAVKAPEQLPLYRTMGLATLDLVRKRGELPTRLVDEMEGLLTDPLPAVGGADAPVQDPMPARGRRPRRQQ